MFFLLDLLQALTLNTADIDRLKHWVTLRKTKKEKKTTLGVIGSACSEPLAHITCVPPQCSILCPILFSIYMLPLFISTENKIFPDNTQDLLSPWRPSDWKCIKRHSMCLFIFAFGLEDLTKDYQTPGFLHCKLSRKKTLTSLFRTQAFSIINL